MENIKSLKRVISSGNDIKEERELELFDDPRPIKKGKIGMKGIFIRQIIMTGLILAGYFFAKASFPLLFTTANNFLKMYVGS
ncbi:MAG: hypothetical protein LBR74_01405 [Eubacterium sp.]|jgi:hypothetical protein|nr:hypothetical protein [Eubacterium sp.]